MNSFKVKPVKLNEIAANGQNLSQTISNDADNITLIGNTLRSFGDSFSIVASHLQIQGGKVHTLSKHANSYYQTLSQISSLYEAADKAVCATEVPETEMTESQGHAGNNADSDTAPSGDIWGKDNSFTYGEMEFHKGDPKRPRWEESYGDYDNFYPYDPNEKPTWKDYVSWGIWSMAPAYELLEYVPDGMKAYEHYRGGSGEPLHIDYEKAYKEDKIIAKYVDAYVNKTNAAIQEMMAKGEKPPFSITSELLPVPENPATENWQKTVGKHYVWISSTITQNEDGTYHISTCVHELDRYNFNKGDADIKTGISDAQNGRFETLGWAKSVDTYGEINFESDISSDYIPGSTPSGTAERNGRSGLRFGADSDRSTYRQDRRDDARR